jgi:hypothetical protein
MSKKSTALIAALLAIIGIQGWLLFQAKKPADKTSDIRASTIAVESRDPAIAQNADAGDLARMEARLSALEDSKIAVPKSSQPDIILGSPEALAADQKIAALLPKGPMTQEELFLFQSQLAQYAASDRAQLSAAFARAINNGQVQMAAEP